MKEREGHLYKAPFTQKELYIALEDVNLDWRQKEAVDFDRLFNSGKDLKEIAKYFKRTELETLILYIDRLQKKKVQARYQLREVN